MKVALSLIAWTLALSGAVVLTAPRFIERINGRVEIKLPEPSPDAKSLYQTVPVVDLHADSLLWPRDLSEPSKRGHVDIPRLLRGRVTLQVFSTVTQVPKGQNPVRNRGDTDVIHLLAKASGWPTATWSSTLERALYQSKRFHDLAGRVDGQLVPIRTRENLNAFLSAPNPGKRVAGLLALEGLHMLEGDLARLDTLFEAGFRMGGLTHFFDNSVGGSAHGWNKGGLTEFGHQVIRRMEALGMVVDLAHASPKLIEDVLKVATRPVAVSHTGVQGTCPGQRNLSDTQLDGIDRNGGLIGIGYWKSAICTAHPDGFAKAARYVAERIGIEHVALGSDFDGAVSTAFDTSELVRVADALLRAGFSAAEVKAIMGGNALDFFGRTLP